MAESIFQAYCYNLGNSELDFYLISFLRKVEKLSRNVSSSCGLESFPADRKFPTELSGDLKPNSWSYPAHGKLSLIN